VKANQLLFSKGGVVSVVWGEKIGALEGVGSPEGGTPGHVQRGTEASGQLKTLEWYTQKIV
jgi:hypothetical protein